MGFFMSITMVVLKKQVYFIGALCWTHLLFYACTIPGTEMPEITFNFFIGLDKLVHCFLFMVFYILWFFTLPYKWYYACLLLLLGTSFGLFIEYYQFNFVDGRGFELADILADGLGCLIGLVLFPRIKRFFILN